MAVDLEKLLTDQLVTQREQYSLDPSLDLLSRVRDSYIRDNTLALLHEVHEALDETSWKRWMPDNYNGGPGDAYLRELVDVLNFLLNLMLATGRQPADIAKEVEAIFYEKKKLNVQRHGKGPYL